MRAIANQAGRQCDLTTHRNHEQTRARLRHKARSVNRHGAEHITEVAQFCAERNEVRALVGGERANNILQRQYARRPSLARKPRHKIAKAVEGAGTNALQPRLRARQR